MVNRRSGLMCSIVVLCMTAYYYVLPPTAFAIYLWLHGYHASLMLLVC